MPVVVSLDALIKKFLIDILVKPKMHWSQFQKLFEMDDGTEFQPDALQAIAELALEQKTGARGLRSILESIMQDTMYTVPSQSDVKKCDHQRRVLKHEPPG